MPFNSKTRKSIERARVPQRPGAGEPPDEPAFTGQAAVHLVNEHQRHEIGRFGVSTVAEGHAAASVAPPTLSSFVARRGVLTALAIGGLPVAIGAGLLVATSDHLVDPIAFGLQVAVMVVGWFSAALYWLVRRPGNRLGLLLLAVAACTAVMSLQGVTEPHLHSIGVLADWLFVLLVFYVIFAFPDGPYRESRRMGAPRRDGARTTGVVRPLALFLAGRPSQSSACRLQRSVSRERLHDRQSADDRRRSFQPQRLDLHPVRGPLRNLRVLDLPASDGDAAAEAGTPACLRLRSDSPRSDPGLLRSPCRARAPGCGRALEAELAGLHRCQRTAIRISAFCRVEHALRRDGVEKDRLPPGREPERLSAAHDAGRCAR